MSTRQKIINKALKGVYAHRDIGNAWMVIYDRSLHVSEPQIKILQDVLFAVEQHLLHSSRDCKYQMLKS